MGRYKVYIIDEVHMLSKSAFNAMLKTLEEPPAHVKFILATTDPQKILVTVLSRCLQFNLRQLSPQLLSSHLNHVLTGEGLAADPKALDLIARAASGSVRDALSLLDQAIAHGAGSVDLVQVSQMLGTSNMSRMLDVLSALIAGDVGTLRTICQQMAAASQSFESALDDLARLSVGLQLVQFDAPEGAQEFSSLATDDALRLAQLAGQCTPQYVQLVYQVSTKARAEMRMAPDPAHGFMMAMLRLLAVHAGVTSTVPVVMPVAPTSRVPSAPAMATPPIHATDTAPATTAPVANIETPHATPAPAAAIHLDAASWPGVVDRLGLKGMARELAQHSAFQSFDAGLLVLNLPSTHRQLLMPASEQRMQQTLSELLGVAVRVRFDVV